MNERIEGVPVGTKLARIGVTNVDDFYIGHRGGIHQAHSGTCGVVVPIIIPDNVYGVIDLSAVPIPEGWERDGDTVEQWFRDKSTCINKDWIISMIGNGVILDDMNGTDRRRIHVRKIKPKTRRVLVAEYPMENIEPCDNYVVVVRRFGSRNVVWDETLMHNVHIEERTL